MSGKFEIEGKTCQNAGNKQTFDLTRNIEIEGKKIRKLYTAPQNVYVLYIREFYENSQNGRICCIETYPDLKLPI